MSMQILVEKLVVRGNNLEILIVQANKVLVNIISNGKNLTGIYFLHVNLDAQLATQVSSNTSVDCQTMIGIQFVQPLTKNSSYFFLVLIQILRGNQVSSSKDKNQCCKSRMQFSVSTTNVNDAFPHQDTRTLGSNKCLLQGFTLAAPLPTQRKAKPTMFWPVKQASCVRFQYRHLVQGQGLRIREIPVQERFVYHEINRQVTS